jgi:CopG family transcriptional regulator, nickel-responsive regulator
MQRVTITIDDDLLAEIDAAALARGYQNRSEIFRDLTRAGLQQSAPDADGGDCVAALVYVYDHASRDLSRRLVENFHGHHDLSLATLHVHLDDHNCMELTALQGPTRDVQHFAECLPDRMQMLESDHWHGTADFPFRAAGAGTARQYRGLTWRKAALSPPY